MRIAVTGADGQLGSNTVRAFLEAGYEVRCLVEPGRDTPTLTGLDVEVRYCDIMDSRGLEKAFANCSGVVNAAGQARYWPRNSETVNRINIGGARSAATAALNAGVDRFVHVGSAGSYSPGSREHPSDETAPLNIGRYRVSYIDSKRESMKLVLELHRSSKLPAVVVNPTFILGAYCSPFGSSSVVYKEQTKPFRTVPSGGRNFIHARDAAAGIVGALENGRPGESYILGNENLTYMELFSMIAEVTGVEAPRGVAAPFLVKAAGHLATAMDLLKGKQPSFTYAVARLTCEDYYYSSAKALRELGLPQTSIREAVGDALNWYRSIGRAE